MKTTLCMLLMLTHGAFAQERQPNQPQPAVIPEVAMNLFKSTGLDKQYEFSPNLKPNYLSGDFDGDGKPDIAILVLQKSSGKIGIAVCHSSTKKVAFIGAGVTVGNGGDNFNWMDIWKVVPKAAAVKKVGRAAAAMLRGDALHVEKSESASALVYWTGKRYVWRQGGD